ncbi:MAG: zinc ribbon domain-containing protein [Treponema sp.]|nr:zinc ribbon domain-containing protein [Treponema sp.]
MAFCTNCGADAKDINFCPKCGTRVGNAPAAAPEPAAQAAPQPRTVTVGQVRKCPSCGSPIESFQSRCGACGHEINSAGVSEAIKEFTTQINSLDEKIAREKVVPEKKSSSSSSKMPKMSKRTQRSLVRTGTAGVAGAVISSTLTSSSSNKSGSGSGKSVVGGFLLIGFFVGVIALIVKITKNFRNAIARPVMSPSEKVKKSYIENFVVPNTREDMLEFVLLASSKAESVIELGSGETMGEISSAHYWAKVWENKCRKVEDRALIALQGDSQTLSQIKSFHDRSKEKFLTITKAKKKGQVKSIILFIFMLTLIVIVTLFILFLLLMFI